MLFVPLFQQIQDDRRDNRRQKNCADRIGLVAPFCRGSRFVNSLRFGRRCCRGRLEQPGAVFCRLCGCRFCRSGRRRGLFGGGGFLLFFAFGRLGVRLILRLNNVLSVLPILLITALLGRYRLRSVICICLVLGFILFGVIL